VFEPPPVNAARTLIRSYLGDADQKMFSMTMQAMPISKNGSCPSGYSSQGNMCVPNANAKPAIPKNGSCPSGWSSQGNYCVANGANPKNVIRKNGPGPSGYSSQGNYCVQN
jgi:hypothetical protein